MQQVEVYTVCNSEINSVQIPDAMSQAAAFLSLHEYTPKSPIFSDAQCQYFNKTSFKFSQ
jgi:hypothetical protein